MIDEYRADMALETLSKLFLELQNLGVSDETLDALTAAEDSIHRDFDRLANDRNPLE